MSIQIAQSDREINSCFPVMQQLRPHLDPEKFVAQVRRQQQSGYQLAFLSQSVEIKAVAGFRLSECLAYGKFLYVDDLITQESDRSQGCGEDLLQWLINYAKEQNCQEFHLDSGVQRFAAHRFYFRQRLEIKSYHFSLTL
jgi:GNAT superfamily N-acetyltransferase